VAACVYGATSKTPPLVYTFSRLAYVHIFVPKVHIWSGFEPSTILSQNVMKICYYFSWPSIDLISKGRPLDPANPGRFNSLVISSIYHVAFRLFSEEQLMSRDKRLTCHEYQFGSIAQLTKLSQAGLSPFP